MGDSDDDQQSGDEGSYDEEGDEEEESDDEEYDTYSFNMEEGDSDEDIDLSHMNVSSDILAILGRSKAEIDAKKAETAGTDWKPPEASGVHNSAPIVENSIESGLAARLARASMNSARDPRSFSNAASRATSNASAPPETPSKPQADEPKEKRESKVEPTPAAPVENGVRGITVSTSKPNFVVKFEPVRKRVDTSGNQSDEDEYIEGDDEIQGWEVDDFLEGTSGFGFLGVVEGGVEESNISASILLALGEISPGTADKLKKRTDEAVQGTWVPPSFSGLANSEKITAMCDHNPSNFRYAKAPAAPAHQHHAVSSGDENSDDEDSGSCYSDGSDDVMDVLGDGAESEDQIIARLISASSHLSPNLKVLLGIDPKGAAVADETGRPTWVPPALSGLSNSGPLMIKKA